MKKCGRCKIEKSDSEFYKRGKTNVNTCYCKECLRKNALIRLKLFKEQCVEYKGGKCELCGYDYSVSALEFHHKKPEQKDFAISKSKMLSFEKHKEKILVELDKCILVCSNCHREIHEQYSIEQLLEDKEAYLKAREECKLQSEANLICSCGKPKSSKANLCLSCVNKDSINRDIKEVIEKIKKLGYVKAGKYYGISDNALRRFIRVRGYDPKSIQKEKKNG